MNLIAVARGTLLFDPMSAFPPSKKNKKNIEPLYTFDRGINPGHMRHIAGGPPLGAFLAPYLALRVYASTTCRCPAL